MTHTLHRSGERKTLTNDYVVLVTPAIGHNEQLAAEKLRRAFDVLVTAGPANLGFYGHGNLTTGIDLKAVRAGLSDTSRLRCCFDDISRLKKALEGLKQLDLGLSVTVSGLMEEVLDAAKELGLSPHTANISLGVFGRTERLPEPAVLDITTMCGHGMIGFEHVRRTTELLRSGHIPIDEAVNRLLAPCTCGIVNPGRTRRLLEQRMKDEG